MTMKKGDRILHKPMGRGWVIEPWRKNGAHKSMVAVMDDDRKTHAFAAGAPIKIVDALPGELPPFKVDAPAVEDVGGVPPDNGSTPPDNGSTPPKEEAPPDVEPSEFDRLIAQISPVPPDFRLTPAKRWREAHKEAIRRLFEIASSVKVMAALGKGENYASRLKRAVGSPINERLSEAAKSGAPSMRPLREAETLYIQALIRLIGSPEYQGNEVDLMDRIERLLGVSS